MMPTDSQQQQPAEPQTGDTRRKRAKIVSACSECRRKKTKCNGETPCKNCAKSNVRCEYPTLNNEDRRNAPTKAAVEAIEDRLKTIEEMLRTILESGSDASSGIDKDSMMQLLLKDRAVPASVEPSPWSKRRDAPNEPRPRHHSMTTAMALAASVAPPNNTAPPLTASMSSSTSARDYYASSSSSSYQSFASAANNFGRGSGDYRNVSLESKRHSIDHTRPTPRNPSPAGTEDIMEGVESVQPRKRDVRLPSIADLAPQPSYTLPSAQAEEALSSHQLPPLNVQDYLFGVYFDHVHMFNPVVDRRDLEMKLKVIQGVTNVNAAQQQGTLSTSATSSVLLLAYAIMAVASEIIPSHTSLSISAQQEYVRHNAESCSKHFFDRAMALADVLPTNQIPTISALCILSRYTGRNDQQQLDLTMSLLSRANRASISFGLHMGEMMNHGGDDPKDVSLCKKLFWSIFCHERLLGGLHGRAFEIEEEDIYIDLPDRNTEAPIAYHLEREATKQREAQRVLPYMNQQYLDDQLKTKVEKIYQDMEIEMASVDFFLFYLKLVKLMGRVIKHNNSNGRSDFWPVNTLYRALCNWLAALPRQFQWRSEEDARVATHVQLLHFLYHMTVLILYRPHAIREIGRSALSNQDSPSQHYFDSAKFIISHSDGINANDANVCYKDTIFQQSLVCATRAHLDLLEGSVQHNSSIAGSTVLELENFTMKGINHIKALILSSPAVGGTDLSRDDVNIMYPVVQALENDMNRLIKRTQLDDRHQEHKRDHDVMESVSEASSSPTPTPEQKLDRPILTPRSPRMKLAQLQQQKQQQQQQQQRPPGQPSLMSLIGGGKAGSEDAAKDHAPAVFETREPKPSSKYLHYDSVRGDEGQYSSPSNQPISPPTSYHASSSSSSITQPQSRSLFQMLLSSNNRTPSPPSAKSSVSMLTSSYSTPTYSVPHRDSSPISDLLHPRLPGPYSERRSPSIPEHYSDTRSSTHPTSPSGSEASRSTDANMDQPMSLYHLAAVAAAAADRDGSSDS